MSRPEFREPSFRVAVVGAGAASSEEVRLATEVGCQLARAGAILICGGLGGVMEAAARGAREAGGRTVESVIAVGGTWGTLSEIALARKIGRPIVTLGPPPAEGLGCPAAEDPEGAVAWALDTLGICAPGSLSSAVARGRTRPLGSGVGKRPTRDWEPPDLPVLHQIKTFRTLRRVPPGSAEGWMRTNSGRSRCARGAAVLDLAPPTIRTKGARR